MKHLETFESYRPLLFSIAYNMLGTLMDAEDMVQETFLRWQALGPEAQKAIQTPKAYLSTIITRLALDQLKSAKNQRETYIGEWLPEPILIDPAQPEEQALLADTLSMAMLLVLEKLSPLERAVFLLRKVFDYDYAEIAAIVGKTESNCRQMMSRAQKHLIAERPLIESTPTDQQQAIIQSFLTACALGDIQQAMQFLSGDVVSYSDGGGKVGVARLPILGAERVARFYIGLAKRAPANTRSRLVKVNGELGILVEVDQKPNTLITFEIAEGRIRNCFNLANPDKLAHILKGASS